jgi:hypothetical protein
VKNNKMKNLLLIFISSIALSACGNSNGNSSDPAAIADSSNVITDSSALMNTDTTSVIGANHIGQGQMRTDTAMSGSNVGK